MTTIALILTLLTLLMSGAGRESHALTGTRIQTTAPAKERKERLREIDSAKRIVETYWISSYETIYTLLSTTYKERLKELQIHNAEQYKNAMYNPERVWRRQTYQKVSVIKKDAIQIVVLSHWEQEGYEGVMTFIFDLVKEGASWKIENIMH